MGLEMLGLMAGGVGKRLVASGISVPKPLIHVAGRPLVDYILTEAYDIGIRRVVAAVRPGDDEVPRALKLDGRFLWEFVETEGVGTLAAIRALLEAGGQDDQLIATCDVLFPRGSVARLIDAAQVTHPKAALVLLVSGETEDDQPVWVHADADGRVTMIGKNAPASKWVFGGIRLARASLRPLVLGLDLEGVSRDTQMLAQLVERVPGAVATHFEPGVLDVDTASDLARAISAASQLGWESPCAPRRGES